ncbi:MAG: UDP-N-acetylglucosamine 2-epimerase (non-hydrolyzing) [Candidatus Hydrogenedentes bacterium]|nr:UDP-N-acetylglucosamine 2-epimerase (non-hydrolyzing) [Candidatus Hydrogenedentota bacterium]
MKRILVCIGTRPEAIKMAPVIRALLADDRFDPIVVSTGQHREMVAQVVSLFDLPIAHDLDVMQPNQTLASLTARLMTSIDTLLNEIQPDLVLVQGDTTTVFVTSLACFYRHIDVAHVEAGLRTGDLRAPFPEEANRKLAAPLMALHFCPTTRSRENLLAEQVPEERIEVTGNTVIDALFMELERQSDATVQESISASLAKRLGDTWNTRPFVLVTGHRRENFGDGFREICGALDELAGRFTDHAFVYPVHLNPNVREPVHAMLEGHKNIHLIDPVDYSEFVALMNASTLVLTDSGGVQEEAPSLGKPVLVMRDATERPEGVDAGTVKLVGANSGRIVEQVTQLLTDTAAYDAMSKTVNPYGDGKAAPRILARLHRFFQDAH